MPVAAVALESACRDRCSKSSAILNERLFDAGGLCLGLADLARSTTQSRLTNQVAIVAGSATGSVKELLGAELLEIRSSGEHWLRARGLCSNLANLSCSVHKPRLSTQIVTIAGSTTGLVTELLATELLELLVKG